MNEQVIREGQELAPVTEIRDTRELDGTDKPVTFGEAPADEIVQERSEVGEDALETVVQDR